MNEETKEITRRAFLRLVSAGTAASVLLAKFGEAAAKAGQPTGTELIENPDFDTSPSGLAKTTLSCNITAIAVGDVVRFMYDNRDYIVTAVDETGSATLDKYEVISLGRRAGKSARLAALREIATNTSKRGEKHEDNLENFRRRHRRDLYRGLRHK